MEVGWCFLTGRAAAMLIKPPEHWSDAAWDPDAEALHRLSRTTLDRKGLAPAKVCEAMNEALAGAAVYSDAPDWDGFWLYRLFDAAKTRRTFELLNFADLFAHVAPDGFQAAKALAQKKSPHKHRAKDDVLHMRTLYRLVAGDGAA